MRERQETQATCYTQCQLVIFHQVLSESQRAPPAGSQSNFSLAMKCSKPLCCLILIVMVLVLICIIGLVVRFGFNYEETDIHEETDIQTDQIHGNTNNSNFANNTKIVIQPSSIVSLILAGFSIIISILSLVTVYRSIPSRSMDPCPVNSSGTLGSTSPPPPALAMSYHSNPPLSAPTASLNPYTTFQPSYPLGTPHQPTQMSVQSYVPPLTSNPTPSSSHIADKGHSNFPSSSSLGSPLQAALMALQTVQSAALPLNSNPALCSSLPADADKARSDDNMDSSETLRNKITHLMRDNEAMKVELLRHSS